MALFNKVLASIGIGAAKVDTRLKASSFQAGETIEGIVAVKGGNIEQKIEEIYLSVMTSYVKEKDDQKWTKQAEIAKIKINEPFVILAKETKEIPFSFQLPVDTPVTIGASKVWIHTGLDIKSAVDPQDTDYIEVEPAELMGEVFNSLRRIGFKFLQVENKEAPFHLKNRLPFIQEFEFYPVSGSFRGLLKELEIVFTSISQDALEMKMEIDRRARGLSGLLAEALDLDERHVRIKVGRNDLRQLDDKFIQTIQRYCS